MAYSCGIVDLLIELDLVTRFESRETFIWASSTSEGITEIAVSTAGFDIALFKCFHKFLFTQFFPLLFEQKSKTIRENGKSNFLLFFLSSTRAILACFGLCWAALFFNRCFNLIIIQQCSFIDCSTLRISSYLECIFLLYHRFHLHNWTWHVLSINIGIWFSWFGVWNWDLFLDRSFQCRSLLKFWFNENNFIRESTLGWHVILETYCSE